MLNLSSQYRKVKPCCDKLVFYNNIQDNYKLGAGNSRAIKLSIIVRNNVRYKGISICS